MKNRNLSVLAAFLMVAVCGFSLTGQDRVEAKKAPAVFKVKFETTAGNFIVEVHRDWSPNGADRFYNLVDSKFYDNCKFFRVVPDFMVQWGIHGDPKVSAKWREMNFKDDPVVKSNKRGFITYAKSGRPHSRTTQVFINFKNNNFLDSQGFSPFGEVIEGMDVVDKINSESGEKPDQGKVQFEGNEYLNKSFPNLDGIKTARIVE